MQLTFNRAGRQPAAWSSLADLPEGSEGVLGRIDLPEEFGHRLMELGFLPGSSIVAARSAPGGDPRVFRVDGTEIALRRETARHLKLSVPEAEPLPAIA